MAGNPKSPFHLWLDSEDLDSESSFVLPSPRLVERPDVPSPLLLGTSDCWNTVEQFEGQESRESDRAGTRESRYGEIVRLRLQMMRTVKAGRKSTLSPTQADSGPFQIKRITRPLPQILKDSSQTHRCSSANRKLFLPTNTPLRAMPFPPSPSSLKVHPLPIRPHLICAPAQSPSRQGFTNPKTGQAGSKVTVKQKETTRIYKGRRPFTPLSPSSRNKGLFSHL